jgi:hypothetical protein
MKLSQYVPNNPPESVLISSPSGSVHITEGDSLILQAEAPDPDNNIIVLNLDGMKKSARQQQRRTSLYGTIYPRVSIR